MVESGEANPVRSMKKQVSFGGRGFEKQMSFKGLLLEKQKSFRKKPRDSPGKRGDSAVHLAARSGNLDRLRELLPLSLSEQNIHGETPLYVAAEHGHSAVVALMLAHMDLHAASLPARNGYDPFHIATRLGHLDVIKEMLRVFPNLAMTTDLSNMTALHTAAAQGHIRVVELLLRSDSDLAKIARNNGKTPLHSAARAGRPDIVCALLSNDPSAALRTDKKGQTPLHMAAKGSATAVLVELLRPDPAVAALPDNKGNTALHIAVAKARTDNVKLLLELSNDVVNALNKAGETPLDIAHKISSPSLVAVLEEAGAKAGSKQQLKQTVSAIKHDVESQLQQSRQTGLRVHKIAKRLKKLHISGLNNAINSATIVAVLIATVAFAAIFTVPGQFEEGAGPREGEAHIAAGGGGAFVVFFVSDSMALFISLAVVVVQTSVVVIEERAKRQLVFVINKLMWLACLSISGAFVSLAYVVVGARSRWLAVFATALGASIMLTTIGSMCYCIVSHRLQESKLRSIRRLESRSRSFSASDSDIRNTDYKRMYAL